MKLLVLTSDPNAGGSSISLLNLLYGLRTYGVNIKVIIPNYGYLSDKLDELQIEYVVDKYIRLHIWPPLKNFRDLFLFLPRLIIWNSYHFLSKKIVSSITKSFKPDIIHSNVSVITEGYEIAKAQKIPHIWHIREYLDKDFGLKFFPSTKFRRKLLKSSASISITTELNKYYNLENSGIVIFNGIRSENYSPSFSFKDNYYLFVGNVNENKGISDLIKGFIKYRDMGGKCKLKIAGRYDMNYYSKLLSLIKSHNLVEEIEFLGQSTEIDYLMQHAKALIVPSKYEAFGRITAEAMFNGCLVIGRNTGGTKEQMDLACNFCGKEVSYRFDSIDELSKVLLSVDMKSYEEIKLSIIKAQMFAKNYLSNEANVEKTYKYFRSIIKTY